MTYQRQFLATVLPFAKFQGNTVVFAAKHLIGGTAEDFLTLIIKSGMTLVIGREGELGAAQAVRHGKALDGNQGFAIPVPGEQGPRRAGRCRVRRTESAEYGCAVRCHQNIGVQLLDHVPQDHA